MSETNLRRIGTPAGIELTMEAEAIIRISQSDTVVSIGCGFGEIESYLAHKYGCSIVGIDINPEFIESAQQKAKPNLRFQVGDGEKLDFPDNSFDIVYSCGALASFFEKGAQEIARVLKVSGKAILIEAAFVENTIPQKQLEMWAQSDEHLPKFLSPTKTEQFFRNNGFLTITNRLYYEPLWWDAYFEELENDNDLLMQKEVYRLYQRQIGMGLFIFQKIPDNEFQI